ncbi:hypothetical protein B0A52_03344 [Exophiala mesophila]|uniref:Hemolysin-III channel protein Izh2 n=1 Tax=Exophiala mesophila TaxID=212818 RepID=A0A438NB42_EXOME|nr:hypothetical protein B0A52_03344 [Exophiala mesophila]
MADSSASVPLAQDDDQSTTASDKAADLWHTLVQWADLPHWQQDNQHIHGSYRKASYSYARSFQSILHWHNESINIWSHLVPATLSLPVGYSLYQVLQPRYEQASKADVIAMSCFFFGAAFCLGMSATYHAVSNHSPSVAKFWNQLDYAGIAILIAGSFVPSVYYGFWCDGPRQMISLLGLACTAVSVLPQFRTPAWRPYRALMFIGMGVSAVFPVLDGLRLFGLEQMQKQIGLFWLVLQGMLYILGAGLYAVSLMLE